MMTNLRLKNPTCRAYIFKRLLSYFFNQINNFIMVLIETVDQKNKNPRLRDLAAQNSRIRDAKKHKKTRFRDSFKTPSRFRDWNKNFRDPEFSGYHSPPLIKLHYSSCILIWVLLLKIPSFSKLSAQTFHCYTFQAASNIIYGHWRRFFPVNQENFEGVYFFPTQTQHLKTQWDFPAFK